MKEQITEASEPLLPFQGRMTRAKGQRSNLLMKLVITPNLIRERVKLV